MKILGWLGGEETNIVDIIDNLLGIDKLTEVLKDLNVLLCLTAGEVLVDEVGQPLVHSHWFEVRYQLSLQVFTPVAELHWYTTAELVRNAVCVECYGWRDVMQ